MKKLSRRLSTDLEELITRFASPSAAARLTYSPPVFTLPKHSFPSPSPSRQAAEQEVKAAKEAKAQREAKANSANGADAFEHPPADFFYYCILVSWVVPPLVGMFMIMKVTPSKAQPPAKLSPEL